QDSKLQQAWTKAIGDRTALTEQPRGEGLIDVGWFRRVFDALGRKRWEALGAAGKIDLPASGMKKASYAGNVILGRIRKKELVDRIKQKQSREAVRLLGLLPLAADDRRDGDLQGRYRVFMGYRRYARSLSPMGREGAQRDLEIGLSNLAQTAGYPDPTRLGWAMEARELADLAAGPISASHEGVTVTLAIDAQVQP